MKKNLTNVEIIEIKKTLENIYLFNPGWCARLTILDPSIEVKNLSWVERLGIEKAMEQVICNFLLNQGYSISESLEMAQDAINMTEWDGNYLFIVDGFIFSEINNIPVILNSFYVSKNDVIFIDIDYKNVLCTAVLK